MQKTHRCRAHIAKKAAEHAHVFEMLVLRCINLKLLMTEMGVRRGKAALSSGCKSHPATLQPEAAGAAMEVTK